MRRATSTMSWWPGQRWQARHTVLVNAQPKLGYKTCSNATIRPQQQRHMAAWASQIRWLLKH